MEQQEEQDQDRPKPGSIVRTLVRAARWLRRNGGIIRTLSAVAGAIAGFLRIGL